MKKNKACLHCGCVQGAWAEVARLNDLVTALQHEIDYLTDSLARSERAMNEAVLNWNLTGVRAEKAEQRIAESIK